jgi:hypothetical protein
VELLARPFDIESDRRKWPPGGTFLSHWGAEEEVYKLGQTKQNPSIIFASFDRVYTSSSAPQCERNVPPGGHFLRSNLFSTDLIEGR